MIFLGLKHIGHTSQIVGGITGRPPITAHDQFERDQARMAGLYEVEIEPEVRSWLASLPDRDFGRAFLVGLLAEHAEDLGEPCTRHLGGKVRELRFHLLRQQTRVTYWLAPQRRLILLTVFRKTRSAEIAEVARAMQAQKICESTHGIAHEVFDREVT